MKSELQHKVNNKMTSTKANILIVDDERTNINVLGSILEKDYEISIAVNGEQALKLISKNPDLDLILLDVEMPGMNGYQVCETLKNDPLTKHIPIIFITGNTEEEHEKKGLELGAVDYITKPFRQAIVKVRLKNHLQLKRQRDLLEHASNHDALTGIANRNRFNTCLQNEWQRGSRLQSHLSLIMLDIDYFKHYNDHYGHVAGDDCLHQVAQSIKQSSQRSIWLHVMVEKNLSAYYPALI
jgi:PleD family two-component response regulator